jgi:GT2 family glycosyltransferase/glycosyltransferase involved in cell wall biosynthesis/SAM-dependent methyltransferase
VVEGIRFQLPSVKPAACQIAVPDYIVWGVIDWHFRHQRPQHLASALAASGRRVFYVSATLRSDRRAGFDLEPLDANKRLFQIKLYVEGHVVIYSSAPGVDTVSQLLTSIGEVLEWADSRQVISLIQHPFWYNIATVLPNSRVIYDCMDHHEGFGNTSAEVLSLERALLRDADLTVTTSEWLDQIVAEHTGRRALIRNASDFEHFAHQPETTYHDPQGRRIIGYYGAIAEWFDQELVEAVAKRFPHCCVLLIGADTVNARAMLGRLPNVKFIGEVPYEALPYYLYGFDVCLLPFKIVPLTLATNPVKVYEYLSAGRAVISVDLPEMKHFGELVRVAMSTDGFLSAIADVLDNPQSTAAISHRRMFAREQTWARRADALIDRAEIRDNDPRVSVIVVTYNNLDLTRACLDSIDEHSDYDPLEVIVVDNASTDGTREFLSEWVTAIPNRRLILNDENRGFAAANNQGLMVASGEYLVILNNDTYVTPGWVRTLVKHLQRDKNLGLIGPVTNNIGNEAKINIKYGSMAEMLPASARYTRRHIGQTLPINTAAFFCVMMPRDVYMRTGPLDEAFGRGFFEDDDYCRRIEQLKLRIVCAKDVFIHHHLSASFNKLKNQDRLDLFERNKAIYEAKWGKWIPHVYSSADEFSVPRVFERAQYLSGHCNVCGKNTRLFYTQPALWRESLNCTHCLTTSRYRSIARGVLRAIRQLTDVDAQSLAELPRTGVKRKLRIYDTQPPFYTTHCAYPLPDLLKTKRWIDVQLSQYKPRRPLGKRLARGVTNQNLECLTFEGGSLDIVITSDVMEHVRLDDRAHREIHRILRLGGVYIFTVPHIRAWQQTLVRIQINDPDDPSKDTHLLEPEYHGDANSDEGLGSIAYRTYGLDLDAYLSELGFEVEYSGDDIPEHGIFNTELYYCRKISQ